MPDQNRISKLGKKVKQKNRNKAATHLVPESLSAAEKEDWHLVVGAGGAHKQLMLKF